MPSATPPSTPTTANPSLLKNVLTRSARKKIRPSKANPRLSSSAPLPQDHLLHDGTMEAAAAAATPPALLSQGRALHELNQLRDDPAHSPGTLIGQVFRTASDMRAAEAKKRQSKQKARLSATADDTPNNTVTTPTFVTPSLVFGAGGNDTGRGRRTSRLLQQAQTTSSQGSSSSTKSSRKAEFSQPSTLGLSRSRIYGNPDLSTTLEFSSTSQDSLPNPAAVAAAARPARNRSLRNPSQRRVKQLVENPDAGWDVDDASRSSIGNAAGTQAAAAEAEADANNVTAAASLQSTDLSLDVSIDKTQVGRNLRNKKPVKKKSLGKENRLRSVLVTASASSSMPAGETSSLQSIEMSSGSEVSAAAAAAAPLRGRMAEERRRRLGGAARGFKSVLPSQEEEEEMMADAGTDAREEAVEEDESSGAANKAHKGSFESAFRKFVASEQYREDVVSEIPSSFRGAAEHEDESADAAAAAVAAEGQAGGDTQEQEQEDAADVQEEADYTFHPNIESTRVHMSTPTLSMSSSNSATGSAARAAAAKRRKSTVLAGNQALRASPFVRPVELTIVNNASRGKSALPSETASGTPASTSRSRRSQSRMANNTQTVLTEQQQLATTELQLDAENNQSTPAGSSSGQRASRAGENSTRRTTRRSASHAAQTPSQTDAGVTSQAEMPPPDFHFSDPAASRRRSRQSGRLAAASALSQYNEDVALTRLGGESQPGMASSQNMSVNEADGVDKTQRNETANRQSLSHSQLAAEAATPSTSRMQHRHSIQPRRLIQDEDVGAHPVTASVSSFQRDVDHEEEEELREVIRDLFSGKESVAELANRLCKNAANMAAERPVVATPTAPPPPKQRKSRPPRDPRQVFKPKFVRHHFELYLQQASQKDSFDSVLPHKLVPDLVEISDRFTHKMIKRLNKRLAREERDCLALPDVKWLMQEFGLVEEDADGDAKQRCRFFMELHRLLEGDPQAQRELVPCTLLNGVPGATTVPQDLWDVVPEQCLRKKKGKGKGKGKRALEVEMAEERSRKKMKKNRR